MQLLDLRTVETGLDYRWPGGDIEHYEQCVEYRARTPAGEHAIRIGFGWREAYGRNRRRVTVWVDDHPQAQFLGTDDFVVTGDLASEIRVPGDQRDRICRYPDEPLPERYAGLAVVGLPTRVSGPGVHGAWAVMANIADHRTLCALGILRQLERSTQPV